jgi:hypothetical protein
MTRPVEKPGQPPPLGWALIVAVLLLMFFYLLAVFETDRLHEAGRLEAIRQERCPILADLAEQLVAPGRLSHSIGTGRREEHVDCDRYFAAKGLDSGWSFSSPPPDGEVFIIGSLRFVGANQITAEEIHWSGAMNGPRFSLRAKRVDGRWRLTERTQLDPPK